MKGDKDVAIAVHKLMHMNKAELIDVVKADKQSYYRKLFEHVGCTHLVGYLDNLNVKLNVCKTEKERKQLCQND